jgi:integrase
MLKQFYEYGMIKQNPYCGIKNSKVINRRQKRILTPSEIENLLQKAKRYPQLHLMIRLCIKTGMKKSEILALHEEDIKNEKIHITKTFYEGEMLPAKTPRELDLPFDFKVAELKNPHLSTITFDNRLRQQFAEITHSIGIYGFRFDDLIQSKEHHYEQNRFS